MKNWSKVRPVIQIHCPLFSFMLTERKKKKKTHKMFFSWIPTSYHCPSPLQIQVFKVLPPVA